MYNMILNGYILKAYVKNVKASMRKRKVSAVKIK